MIQASRLKALSFIIISSIAIGLTACTDSKPIKANQSDADLVSNRPVNETASLYVITLSHPALLTTARMVNGNWEIPEQAKLDLQAELDAFLKRLRESQADAQVVYRYRLTINGVALYTTAVVAEQIQGWSQVKGVAKSVSFSRPEAIVPDDTDIGSKTENQIQSVNSANFIGSEKAYEMGFTGQGMRVGILDTGIDYTHKMLGGSGSPDEYAGLDPVQPNALFPNRKVVGGIDLVGTDFDAGSLKPENRLPHPDANPLDEAGHGTHVAGTVAGIAIGGDSFAGVAKDADLYAIKVFGKDGSTSDATVIAGFEFSADPNGDLNIEDRLDVINLSLGGGFGQPHILYSQAVKNLSRTGTLVVASAGNSGPVDYIVGAPGTSDDALSVAASVDGSIHNWQFRAVRFISPNNSSWLVKATEGPISKPIAESPGVSGRLVDIGMANTELTEEQKAALKGNIALIQRGEISFVQKLETAKEAGAVGAVVYNNQPGKPLSMGGDKRVEIPAIMVSQALGQKLLSEMKIGAVKIEFSTDELIRELDVIDTITEFSSKGPRSDDNLFKPEIAAPGQQIISAAMGKGTETVKLNGTSMSAPHMTGAMALIKQAHKDFSIEELKALAMGSSKELSQTPMTLQGAGRIQLEEALRSPIVSSLAALSLGRLDLSSTVSFEKTVWVRNITDQEIALSLAVESNPGLSATVPASLTLKKGESRSLKIQFTADPKGLNANSLEELNARIQFQQNGKTVYQISALALRKSASEMSATMSSTGELSIFNASTQPGLALPFNLIGRDERKPEAKPGQEWRNRSCDLESAGYRIFDAQTKNGTKRVLQVAFKIHSPVTMWLFCEPTMLVDSDGDQSIDQEVAGASPMSLEGVSEVAKGFYSAIIDSKKAQEIRGNYESALANGEEASLSYKEALDFVGPMAPFPQSTVTIIEVPVDKLKRGSDGRLHFRLATLGQVGDMIEADDYLYESDFNRWMSISLEPEDQGYMNLPEDVTLINSSKSVTLTPGKGKNPLVVYYPLNVWRAGESDGQSQIY